MNIVRGVLGWGNERCDSSSSLEAYGPGGRWGKGADPAHIPFGGRSGQSGDLLADALARLGESEGAQLIVVSISRNDVIDDPTLVDDVEALIRSFLDGLCEK